MKSKLRAIWRILTSKYFIAFTFNDRHVVALSGLVDHNTNKHSLVQDVILAIKKQDYIDAENS